MDSYDIITQTPTLGPHGKWADTGRKCYQRCVVVEAALAIISEDKKSRAQLDAEILKEFALLLSPNNNDIPTPKGYPHHRIGLP